MGRILHFGLNTSVTLTIPQTHISVATGMVTSLWEPCVGSSSLPSLTKSKHQGVAQLVEQR